ncbi:uncharacterized protein K460DRAFT_409533 [Cucurbitaria berberidis CBS 394.84]|uniref:Impact N-terminal domain-containing protein n=1 Tax=Cucurbitaria berberidis CBS 394.84 TaxID=1168544 RepID=A0A9P4GBC1_9PLEO|nr:uncharacterized protein K460DRAFT_409533 [Cucurbitaria berberidis CBS 394.84]KAF1842110.1 hypothetical protein K460DRAFT_409533 [Cucurbitaria berberidis CBS 394.84]
MTSAQEVQSLLRFLSQDAKLPLAQAMGKVKNLQAAKLVTASDLSKADFESLKTVFGDEKVARQVLNAAKRASKKRASSDASAPVPAPSPKKAKPMPMYGQPLNPTEFEASLALPEADCDEEKLKSAVIYTNRAPLVLAFACTLLKYTMPEQPISSRLSLAQAVTSMNSKNKAIHVGLDTGQAAEDEGWGEGQPIMRIMTRDVRVMKRWGYEWEEESTQGTLTASTQETLKSSQETLVEEAKAKDPALWGVDLEALKKANQPGAGGSYKGATSQLPIYTAQSARAYLMKAFETPKVEGTAPAKRTNTGIVAEKERNLSLLLGALELLYQSWADVLSSETLNNRAWGWYVRVRPDVAHGAAGWGGKGNVKLSDILELRRPAG